jgi:hypothetical protein
VIGDRCLTVVRERCRRNDQGKVRGQKISQMGYAYANFPILKIDGIWTPLALRGAEQ